MDADWCLVCDSRIPFEHYDSSVSSAFCSPACLAKAQADAQSRSTSPVHPPAQSMHPRPYCNTTLPGRPSRGVGSRHPRLSMTSSEDSGCDPSALSPTTSPLVTRPRQSRAITGRWQARSSDGREDDSEAPSFSTLDTSAPSDGCGLTWTPEDSTNARGGRSHSQSSDRQSQLSTYSAVPPSNYNMLGADGGYGSQNGRSSSTSSIREITTPATPSRSDTRHSSFALPLSRSSRSILTSPTTSGALTGSQSSPITHGILSSPPTAALPKLRDANSRLIEAPNLIPSSRVSATDSVGTHTSRLTVDGLARVGSAERLAQYLADIRRIPASSVPLIVPGASNVDLGRADEADLDEVAHALYAWGGLISSRASRPQQDSRRTRAPVPLLLNSPWNDNTASAYADDNPYILSSQSGLFRPQRDRQRAPARRPKNAPLSSTTPGVVSPGPSRSTQTIRGRSGNQTPTIPTLSPTSAVNEARGRQRDRDMTRARERERGGGEWCRRTDSQEARGHEGDAEEDGIEYERPRGRSTVQRRVSWGVR